MNRVDPVRWNDEVFATIAGVWSIAVGILVEIGWALDVDELKTMLLGVVAMNPLTALNFIACGAAILLHSRSSTRFVREIRWLGLAVSLVGVACFLGPIIFDFRLDRVFFTAALGTNRMAPNTALTFVALGSAIGLVGRPPWKRFRTSDVLALFSLASGMIAVAGYVYGAGTLYGVKGFIPMAFMTGIVFVFASIGILFVRPQEGIGAFLLRNDFGGRIARALLPIVIPLPLLLGWFVVYGVREEWFVPQVGYAISSVSTMMILTALISWTATSLSKSQAAYDAQNRLLESVLRDQNAELERKVQERIEELRKAESQVQQLQKMDAVGRLAGGVAHDFNNLLAAINMYCDLLSDDGVSIEEVKENAGEIRKVADRGAGLTKQLLIFSRKQVVQYRSIHLPELISQFKKMLDRLIPESITIKTIYQDGLATVRADAGQLEQIIMNLVVNARDAMPKGGTVTIETGEVILDRDFSATHLSVVPGPHVFIAVTDTGIGMDEEVRSRLFEPFFTTKDVGKGTGLGLATVYGIVKQLNGSIWVYSEPGKGTTFRIYLRAEEQGVVSPVAKEASPRPVSGDERILLVEDETELRKLFSAVLKRHGYRVETAINGRDALSIVEGDGIQFDLVVSDVMMPEMGGFDLAKRIGEISSETKFLFLSGYASDDMQESGPPSKDFLFLQKPFDARSLLAKVREALDG